MRYSPDRQMDELILVARILLVALFVISGWGKLTEFSATVGYMKTVGAPLPTVATAIAVVMELFVGLAILIGFYTRTLALLLALFTLGTALIGHHFWTMSGDDYAANLTEFLKNMSIIGGLLFLSVTGPGKYSADRRWTEGSVLSGRDARA